MPFKPQGSDQGILKPHRAARTDAQHTDAAFEDAMVRWLPNSALPTCTMRCSLNHGAQEPTGEDVWQRSSGATRKIHTEAY